MAERNLYEKIGDVGYENLFADINPAPVVGSVPVTPAADTVLKRGSVLNADGVLFPDGDSGDSMVLGVVCEDISIAKDATENVPVFKCGSFNGNALVFKEGAEIGAEEIAILSMFDIYVKFAQELGE